MEPDIFYFYIVGGSLVAVLHCMGLILLYKCKSDLPNQRLLIINLAVVEMFTGIFATMYFVLTITGHHTSNVRLAERFLLTLSTTRVRFTVLHIILDRFLEIYLSVKYPIMMTLNKMMVLNSCLWLLSVVFAIINTVLMHLNGLAVTMKFVGFVLFILDIVIIVAASSTYIYFYVKVKEIRTLERSANGEPSKAGFSLVAKKFKVPCYIVLTYILFNFTSSILAVISEYVKTGKGLEVMDHISVTLDIVAYTSDAFIYVFMNKDIRLLLRTTCCAKNARISNFQINNRSCSMIT